MNKQQLVLLAKREIDARRAKALDRCEDVLNDLRSHEDWRVCESALKAAQVAVAFHNDAKAKQKVAQGKAKTLVLLKKYGYEEKDLHPVYSCNKCHDSGYVDGEMCVCLQTELRKLLVKESNISSTNFTFENSHETNKHNLAVYKKAQEVCNGNGLKNMLLTGGTGTGKTYLLSACLNLCASLDKSVLFTTAYNLNSLFLECHLSDLDTKHAILSNLTDVDVLAIDDLGTESVYKNVTAEYFFAVVNERISSGKQTFISTNLTLADIRERYDERIFSRLIDQKITFVAQLEGDDKRLKK